MAWIFDIYFDTLALSILTFYHIYHFKNRLTKDNHSLLKI